MQSILPSTVKMNDAIFYAQLHRDGSLLLRSVYFSRINHCLLMDFDYV